MSGHDVIDLDELASRTLQYADQLRKVSQRFNGREDGDRKIPGIKLQYEEALDSCLDAIVESYEVDGKRPPAEDIRAARARRMVKLSYPDLYDEYHALEATMKRIERWLRDARSATMARQSVLKTERELAGRPGGYQ